MKIDLKSLILGVFVGILGMYFYSNRSPGISDGEFKREATLKAHRYVKARSMFDNRKLKIRPAVQKTKVTKTDLGTYVVELRSTFNPGIWTHVPGDSPGSRSLITDYDWTIECKWTGEKMEVLDASKDFIFFY